MTNEQYKNGVFSSKSDEWETPQSLFDRLNKIFCFELDAAASDTNHKCEKYYTKEQNALNLPWGGYRTWCNPPYGRQIGDWVKKASETVEDNESCVVMLIPARTDTKWFHEYIAFNPRAHVIFLKGRLKFGNSTNSAPFPSMIVVFV